MDLIRQYGALPYRIAEAGVQFLLVTSRDTGRWVIPKGNPMLFRSGGETAAEEAFEEAGVRGAVAPVPIGRFCYCKRRRLAADVTAQVSVYPLRVAELLDEWPEAQQRQRQWFTREEAAAAVAEDELKALILGFER